MARPGSGDWTPVYGRTRVNRTDDSTPIENLGASQDVIVSDLNVSHIQASRWLGLDNANKVPIQLRTEVVESYDSVLGILIEDM